MSDVKESVCNGELVFTEPLNGCWPVQAKGYILGREFFFTAKQGTWIIGVSTGYEGRLDKFSSSYTHLCGSGRTPSHLACLAHIASAAEVIRKKYSR